MQFARKQKLEFEELLAAILVIFYSVNDRNSNLIAKITANRSCYWSEAACR